MRYLLDFDLKICSGQVWGTYGTNMFALWVWRGTGYSLQLKCSEGHCYCSSVTSHILSFNLHYWFTTLLKHTLLTPFCGRMDCCPQSGQVIVKLSGGK